MTTIIGLCGPAGSGKSTIAAYLETHLGAKRYAFADPLKLIAMRTLDMTREQCYGTQEQKETKDPRYGFSPRWFLQRLGTEGIRSAFGPDVWWKMTLEKIRVDAPELAVIEDVRFVNEAVGLVDAGALVWRLQPPGFVATADVTHQSEMQWTMCPYTSCIAPQERGLEHLYNRVDGVLYACYRDKKLP